MKSYGVTIPIKPFWEYFHTALYNYLVCGSNFGSVEEILWHNHSYETSSAVFSHGYYLFSV